MNKMKSIFITVAFVATSTAIPISGRTPNLVERDPALKLATFDNLGPADVGLPIPVPYEGLHYFNLYLDAPASVQTPPIILPVSSPYYATASGSSGFSTQDTSTQSFDIDSFYFGCFDARELEAVSCQFTVTGLNADDGRHQGPILLTYVPNAVSGANAMLVELGWSGLSTLNTDIYADNATFARTVQVIDNVKYTIH